MSFTHAQADELAETMADHDLVAVSAVGWQCNCGTVATSWLEHLAEVALTEMFVGPSRRHLRTVAEPADETLRGDAAAKALAQAAQVLADMQAWHDTLGEACALNFDLRVAAWPDVADWFMAVPRYLPPAAASRWLRGQRVQADWRKPRPVITARRQLELAMGAQPRFTTREDIAS